MRHIPVLLLLVGCFEEATDPQPFAALPVPPHLEVSVIDAQADAGVDARPDGRVDAQAPDAGPDACGATAPADALRLDPDEPAMGNVCAGRSAWYAVDVAADHDLSLVLEFAHRIGDLELAIYADGDLRRPLAESTSASNIERIALPRADGPRRLVVRVYGFRDATGPFTLTARSFSAATALPTTVRGTVRWFDRPFGRGGFTGDRPRRPARGLRVIAQRVVDGADVAVEQTDAQGAYAITFDAQPGQHRVLAVARTTVDGLFARAVDADANASYALEGGEFAAGAAAVVDLEPDLDAPINAALNIVDTAWEALDLIAPFVGEAEAGLTFRWQPGHPWGCGSCYAQDVVRLGGQLADPDEYDDVIILHELAHWFVDHFSDDDSPGGTHRDRVVSPQLAYGEGLAYFFAGLVRDDPLVVDTFIDAIRLIDMEAMTQDGMEVAEFAGTSDGRPTGDMREELVEGAMWDLYDPPSDDEPFDTVALGPDVTLALLVDVFGAGDAPDVGAPGIDLADWLEVVACREGAEPVAAVARDRGYPWAAPTACEKGRVEPPIRLEGPPEALVLSVKGAPLQLHVRRGRPGAWKVTPLACAHRCPLAPLAAHQAVVVSAPNQPWAGVERVGPALRETLVGGRLEDGRRLYRSR